LHPLGNVGYPGAQGIRQQGKIERLHGSQGVRYRQGDLPVFRIFRRHAGGGFPYRFEHARGIPVAVCPIVKQAQGGSVVADMLANQPCGFDGVSMRLQRVQDREKVGCDVVV